MELGKFNLQPYCVMDGIKMWEFRAGKCEGVLPRPCNFLLHDSFCWLDSSGNPPWKTKKWSHKMLTGLFDPAGIERVAGCWQS